MLRKILKTILVFLIVVVSWSLAFSKINNLDNFQAGVKNVKEAILGKCSSPLIYSIGTIDPRFGISQEDFLKEAEAAETVWEKTAKKNLFQYDPQASFKINLVFDLRQIKTNEFKQLQQQFQDVDKIQKNLQGEYNTLKNQYQKKQDIYNAKLNKYEKEVAEYNKDVQYWNQRGGAPEDEYLKLQDREEEISDLAKDLEGQREDINDLVSKINSLAKKEKSLVEGYNQAVETYSSRYGGSKEFDQGVYTGEGINIYQFNDFSDLELVLAHELGHYLGLGHDQNPKSIMYYLMGEQDLNNIAPTQEDLQEVESVCKK